MFQTFVGPLLMVSIYKTPMGSPCNARYCV